MDKDGQLSLAEVTQLAAAEYGFEVSKELLKERLGSEKVEEKEFQRLRTLLGILRLEQRKGKADENKVEKDFESNLVLRRLNVEKDLESVAWSDLEAKIGQAESGSEEFLKASKEMKGRRVVPSGAELRQRVVGS